MGRHFQLGSWIAAAGVIFLIAASAPPSPVPTTLNGVASGKTATPIQSAPPQPPVVTAQGFSFNANTDSKESSGPWHCGFVKGFMLNGLYIAKAWICTPIE